MVYAICERLIDQCSKSIVVPARHSRRAVGPLGVAVAMRPLIHIDTRRPLREAIDVTLTQLPCTNSFQFSTQPLT